MPNYGLGPDNSKICWPLQQSESGEQQSEWVVYPNPADAFIAIDLDHCYTANSTFKLFDFLGREVLQTTLSAGSNYTRLDIHSIPEGIYLYQIVAEGNKLQTGKLIIE